MAGEDYTSPNNGLTFTVPKYEEPADAPVAFKDFADSIGPTGIDIDATRDDAVLQVQDADGVKSWVEGMALSVVDEVPDDADGEIGDVVFVLGDDPKGQGGGLEGVGDWAELTAMTGDPKRYDYTADGVAWAAFEWTGTGSVKTSDGLLDCLVCSGGGGGNPFDEGDGGRLRIGIEPMAATTHDITVGSGGVQNNVTGKPSALGDIRTGFVALKGQHTATALGAGGTVADPRAGVVSGITGNDVTYAAANVNNSTSVTANNGCGSTTKGSEPSHVGNPGVVIIRVPASKVSATGGWV